MEQTILHSDKSEFSLTTSHRLGILSDDNEYNYRKEQISKCVKKGSFCIDYNFLFSNRKLNKEEKKIYKKVYDWSIDKTVLLGSEVRIKLFDRKIQFNNGNGYVEFTVDKINGEKKIYPYTSPNIVSCED
jgi:hypothetical protein